MSQTELLPISAEYPFASHYLEVKGQKLHYIDQGSGNTILFIHGNPTWSYLWRNIIPYLEKSARCVAVDLIGMGPSDKPDIGYTFQDHVDYISEFIEKLGLKNIVLVGHDWGSAIGLQYALHHTENVKAVAMLEPQALYPCADWSEFSPEEAKELFQKLRDPEHGWSFMRENSAFIEGMTKSIINRPITPEAHNQYREPFKDLETRKPMSVFPNQIPIEGQPSEVIKAIQLRNEWFMETAFPKILFYATPGCTIREPQLDWCRKNLQNLTLYNIGNGYHYLLEENPEAIGQELQRWFQEING